MYLFAGLCLRIFLSNATYKHSRGEIINTSHSKVVNLVAGTLLITDFYFFLGGGGGGGGGAFLKAFMHIGVHECTVI